MAILASCVGPSRPAPAPAPRPVAPIAPPPAPPPMSRSMDWRDAPITPGDWHWAHEGNDSVARFGTAGSSMLALRCTAGRMVTIDLPGNGATQQVALTITTSSQKRSLWAQPRGTWLEVSLGARDTVLDAMAFSRGRFMVEAQGSPPLYMPSWPEVTRVIEDCR